ncbi:MAG: SAF domain-containing protein [Mycobacteriaceae bacterium]
MWKERTTNSSKNTRPTIASNKARNQSLNLTLPGRVSAALHSGWSRKPIVRQITAAALVILAAALAIRGNPQSHTATVLIASRDLRPGEILKASDVQTTQRTASTIPKATLTSVDQLDGRTIASPIRAGEILTDVRIIGPRLASAAISAPEARIVPIHLSDPALTDLVHEGDIVDVLAVSQDETAASNAPPLVLATKATVILVSPKTTIRAGGERVVMLALPLEQANIVATTALIHAITVTFH